LGQSRPGLWKSLIAANPRPAFEIQVAVRSIRSIASNFHENEENKMKSFLWVLAGIGTGIAAYLILSAPSPQYATGSDDVEDAANKTAWWGAKQRFKGTGGRIAGKVKENLGRATGDEGLATEGAVDQVAGAAKETAGQAAGAVSDTVRNLNF
jgi:uncharacterized protein YjbJ (UPF0337 family)